jgi:hypothetical protein
VAPAAATPIYTWLLLQLHQSIRGSCCNYCTPVYMWLLLQLHLSIHGSCRNYTSLKWLLLHYTCLYVALASTTSVYTWLLLQQHQYIRGSCCNYTSLYVAPASAIPVYMYMAPATTTCFNYTSLYVLLLHLCQFL